MDWVWLAFLLRAFGERDAARLVVNWWTPNDVAAISRQTSECGKEPSNAESFTATLMVCPGADPYGPRTPVAECKAKAAIPIPVGDRAGSLVFEDIPRGHHVLLFRAGNSGPSSEPLIRPIRVYGDKAGEEHVEVRWTMLYGKVTKNGKPFHGKVFEASVTDPETGGYTVALPRLPGTFPVSVQPCDGSQTYWFVPESEPAENTAFDIEIPENGVDLDVVEAGSGQPIEGARVNYAAVKDRSQNSAHFSMRGGVSDEKGRVTIGPLALKIPLKLCARHEQYENACSDEFLVGADERKRMRMELVRIEKREGRLFTPGRSQVAWHALDGLSEQVVTDEEGRFTYKRPHARGEIVTVSSAAGFFVLVQPPLEAGEVFEIRLPGARLRTFEVHLAKTSADEFGFFTIALGDLIVPHEPFATHLMRTDQQHSLRPGSTTVVASVFETAPISVLYAPKPFIETRMPYWWMRPEARTLPRRALGDQTRVTFE